jgi:RNA polymerase sigma factor (sigma-70 family)
LIETYNILPKLIREAALGSGNAKQQLYLQFGKAMYNICVRMLGEAEDAKDVLQDSFIKAFDKLHQLKDENSFGGWLKMIVIRECISFGKKMPNYYALNDNVHELPNEEASLVWWKEIPMSEINNAIKSLPNGCREIFTLYAVENFTHNAIASQLNISDSTSKSQYQRARKLLKETLENKFAKHG